jgi:hypothetical protein
MARRLLKCLNWCFLGSAQGWTKKGKMCEGEFGTIEVVFSRDDRHNSLECGVELGTDRKLTNGGLLTVHP